VTRRASSRRIGAAALACAGTLLAVTPAWAVMPKPGAEFTVFDHRTVGDGWHIQMTVAKDGRFLRQLVLYSEHCNATVLTGHVRIRDDGTIASSKPFAASRGRQGTWRLDAAWTAPDHVEGSFQITRPGCDGGVRRFAADAERPGAPGHVHTSFGTPVGSYPNMGAGGAGSRRARAQVRRLWRDSRREAKRRFASYRGVRALGFTRFRTHWKRPVLFHVRHLGYRHDNRTFDATRPESLVYWWPADRGPILIGFMYRAPLKGGWPKFGKPLLGWHTHGGADRPGATLMTHVWMTNDLRSAIANCMPAKRLEAANPRLRFQPPSQLAVRESRPCPEEQP
jgi:hypothetical protein